MHLNQGESLTRRVGQYVRGAAVFASVVIAIVSCSLGMGCPYDFPPVFSAGRCGDGLLADGEECDDQNLAPGDGCNELCLVEHGWSCDGEPSQCVTACGDGIVAGAETCDDGNEEFGDGCNGDCLVECSNGSVEDCNWPGSTLNPDAAFVDSNPPAGFIQCAGFQNTDADDVDHLWETRCLGEEKTLRIRFWDTSTDPWTLLADSTLIPNSTKTWEDQTFDATDHAGVEGLKELAGVTLLKDATDTTTPSHEGCDFPAFQNDYRANDLYAANRMDTKSFWVCSMDDDYPEKVCEEGREIVLANASLGTCLPDVDVVTSLAVSVYEKKSDQSVNGEGH